MKTQIQWLSRISKDSVTQIHVAAFIPAMDPRPPLDRLVDGQLLHRITRLCWWAYPGRWDAGPLGRPRERQQQPRKQQRQRVSPARERQIQ